MSAQVETVEEKPPRDGADASASPAAEPSKGDGDSSADLKGAGSGGVEAEKGTLEDFLYVDVDVEDSAKKDDGDGDAGDLGAKAAPAAEGVPMTAVEMMLPAEGRGLVSSASKELLAKLVRSLSTPMMDGTSENNRDRENSYDDDDDDDAEADIETGEDPRRTLTKQSRPTVGRGGVRGGGDWPRNLAASRLDDWAGVEDPDWKANHQLSWRELTDVREIGKGLTCTVYTAKVPGRKAKVIAKVARPRNNGRLEDQAERQLEAEFNVLRQANHAHVVELLGAGFTPEGRRFLLLEHLPEGTLGTFHALSAREEMRVPSAYWTLKNGFRRLTKDLSYTLGRVLQVAEALQYLHNDAIPGAMVLHRDIRPDNVGLARGGVVKIFDFGLSKAVVKDHEIVGETGSLRYSAPEVSMALPHGDKADVYSWSLLAWSVASGRTPFEGVGRSAFYSRVVVGGERPELDPRWPKEFHGLLKDCWNGDPSLRPDMTEVVIRMKALLHAYH
eukprot:g19118.t2